MPAFSFHRPRFLRSRRSWPSSRLGIPGKDMNVTPTGASHPSVPRNHIIDHQNSTDRLVADYSNAQPSQVLQPVTSSGFVPPNAIRMPEAPGPAVQEPNLLASSSNHNLIPRQHSDHYSPLPQHQNPAMFNQAQNFTVMGGSFFAGNVTHNDLSSNQFMEKLLEKTIPGAEFDSSARDPPPRCHPGTRLAILDRCLYFIHNCNGMRKMRWVVGAAGVGKSALLQSVVESPKLAASCHASVFFSINGRDDGTKAVATICYQLAAKSKTYRQLIETKIIDDPSLLRSSMTKQFLKLIVEPFIHNPQLNSANRILVVIDGLDECKSPRTQLELLQLISDLCIDYPSSPSVWLIASRPETHITSFFSRVDVAPAYEKEEIAASDSVESRWPEERDLWKLANAAGGLFAYADTAVRYIDDASVGSPASQLSDVLNVIDDHPMTDVPQEDHPMALLDALYARILSNVPSKVMMNTRKILLALAFDWFGVGPHNFVLLCHWLGMTPDEAYAALNHLRSVLHVPRRDEAYEENLEFFHKSFMDYISDFRRSGFSHDIQHDGLQLMAQCAFRVLNEAPDGINFGDVDYILSYGTLRRGPGFGDNISVTWPDDEGIGRDDNEMRLGMYRLSIRVVANGMKRGDPTLQNASCILILSTLFEEYNGLYLPLNLLRNLAFDDSRRQEFMAHGILKQMPVKAVDVFTLKDNKVKLQFRRPATIATNMSDPWYPSCSHKREDKWEEGDDQN
ncbi:hypothetical protein Agabi119p4_7981 [Agaricus bisporus var. burnettii]|uniref:Nephrocystin 3-like N-terminal domain-containing protein n=1 Tax=Agaricus bisporus var. burnettii TaxID=192524 RepID=A0A8H7C6B4_AGABI|nr:hypothetical protein Agabi119p4_7981 [Agaricus bisporus var. burnettii]